MVCGPSPLSIASIDWMRALLLFELLNWKRLLLTFQIDDILSHLHLLAVAADEWCRVGSGHAATKLQLLRRLTPWLLGRSGGAELLRLLSEELRAANDGVRLRRLWTTEVNIYEGGGALLDYHLAVLLSGWEELLKTAALMWWIYLLAIRRLNRWSLVADWFLPISTCLWRVMLCHGFLNNFLLASLRCGRDLLLRCERVQSTFGNRNTTCHRLFTRWAGLVGLVVGRTSWRHPRGESSWIVNLSDALYLQRTSRQMWCLLD